MKAVIARGKLDLHIEQRPIDEPDEHSVRIKLVYAGICGSDLHYYQDGRIGASVIREPMVLGHEVSAVVDAIGSAVTTVKVGQRVTLNPSDQCDRCQYCRTGRQNLCPSLRYLGSAAKIPHTQGIMQEYSVVQARQCIALSDQMDMQAAACVEPLGIALHAVGRAGNLLGKRVFIAGAGPIGALLATVSAYGGARTVAISDIAPFPLQVALKLGATDIVNARDDSAVERLSGQFDIAFEASGSESGMHTAIAALAAGGRLVHVGYLPHQTMPYPVNLALLQKEIVVTGSQRAFHEFAVAADLLDRKRIDVTPLITSVFPLARAEEAIRCALDKTQSMKVLLAGE